MRSLAEVGTARATCSRLPSLGRVGRWLVIGTAMGSVLLGLTGPASGLAVRASCDLAFTGTQGSDEISANRRDNHVCLLGGNDVGYGRNGADTIRGGPGDDHVYDGKGRDWASGGRGDDIVSFADGEGVDTLVGGLGNDHLYGGSLGGRNTLYGGRGRDRLVGSPGWRRHHGDILFGGRGVDFLNGKYGADRLEGGDGDDRIKGSGNKDVLLGQAGDDIMYAQDGYTDNVDCGPGNDDVAYVDARDSVTADCETVLVAAGP
ncbi:MAG TPA: calcium-binding protein [Actinomycetes bacterium]|nr:calcium-binding protein [Actinomycetes bacterium]